MRCLDRNLLVPVMVLLSCVAALAQTPDVKDIGRAATPEEVQAWDLTVLPSGQGLPPGKGTAKEGAVVWVLKCAMCHGPEGEGAYGPRVVAGQGTPGRPVGTMGPFATTIWQYIRRAMPLYPLSPNAMKLRSGLDPNAPLEPSGAPLYPSGALWGFQDNEVLLKTGVNPHLTFDEIYALTAFILYKSGIITEDTVMDQETLPKVEMPNRSGYIPMGPDGKVPEWKPRDPKTRIEPHVSPNSKPLPAGSGPVNVVP